MTEAILFSVKFDERGLIPAVIQDASTSEIIALHQMDNATLLTTLQTGEAAFLSNQLGHPEPFKLVDVRVNSDGGSLTVLIERPSKTTSDKMHVPLLNAEPVSPGKSAGVSLVDVGSMEFGIGINRLYSLIVDRKDKRPEGSYTTYLFNSGLDKILKKVAEESGEVIIAAKNASQRELVSELADLFYHLLVLMVDRDLKLGDVQSELNKRAAQAGSSEQ